MNDRWQDVCTSRSVLGIKMAGKIIRFLDSDHGIYLASMAVIACVFIGLGIVY